MVRNILLSYTGSCLMCHSRVRIHQTTPEHLMWMKNYANNEEPKKSGEIFLPSETLSPKMRNRHSSLKKKYTSKPQLWQVTPGISGSLKTGSRGSWPWRRQWPTRTEFFSEEVTIDLQSHKVEEEHCNRRTARENYFFSFSPKLADSCTGLVSLASVRIRWFCFIMVRQTWQT